MSAATVFDRIRDDILSCKLAPGSAVYEQELAQKLGVSKSPVREALLRLQEQRLVEVRPRSGYRVRPVSFGEAGDMYEMRLLYERACIARAIDQATDGQIEGLRKHLTEDAQMATNAWLALNRAFHSGIAAIAGNARLADAADRLNEHFDRFTIVGVGLLQQPVDFTRFNEEHAAIVDALQARRKRAALSLITAHVEASRQRTLQALASPAVVP